MEDSLHQLVETSLSTQSTIRRNSNKEISLKTKKTISHLCSFVHMFVIVCIESTRVFFTCRGGIIVFFHFSFQAKQVGVEKRVWLTQPQQTCQIYQCLKTRPSLRTSLGHTRVSTFRILIPDMLIKKLYTENRLQFVQLKE